jgi:hypothetical protein
VGGGSTETRPAEPIAYVRSPIDPSNWPLVVFLAVLVVPVAVVTTFGWVRRRRSPIG